MKLDDAKSLLDLIRSASATDIAVVSFILLPLLLGAWSLLLKDIGVTGSLTPIVILLLAAVYILAVIVMKYAESSNGRIVRAARQIRNRLAVRPAPNTNFGTFDYIRSRVNQTYTDEFLSSLIDRFPEDFMKGRSRDGRPAVRLVVNEPTQAEEAPAAGG